MAETVADVVIGVSADVGPLMRATDRAGRAVNKFGADMARDLGNGARGAVAAMGQASAAAAVFGTNFVKGLALGLISGGIAGVTTSVRAAIGSIADMADEADRIGVSAKNFQALQYGMKLAGVQADEFSSSLSKFSDNLGDAARGSGKLGEMLKENNIDLRDGSGAMRDTTDILADFADMIQRVPDEATRMSLITEAFGKSGKAMTLALADGSAGLDAMKEAAAQAGVVIEDDVITKARILDDEFDILTAKIDVFFKNLAVKAAQGAVDLASVVDQALTSDAATPVVDVQASYDMDALTASARTLSNTISMTALAMSELEDSAVSAMVLADLSAEVDQLTVNLQNGTIGTDEYQKGLQAAVAKADSFLISLGDINGIDMAGARGELASIGKVIDGLIGKAIDAAAEIAAIAAGPVVSHGGRAEAPEYVSEIAPTTSPRPGVRPINFDYTGGAVDSGGGGGGGGGSMSSASLDALIDSLETEREVVDEWYAESAALLANATDAQLEQLGGRYSAIERLEQEHQERLSGIRGGGDNDALANASSFFGSLATITQAGGEKANKAYRAFAAAEALINAYRAASQALADRSLPFFAKFAAVASVIATGMGLVSALKSGGGSGGGGSSGAAAGGAAPAAAPQSVANITLNGDMFSRSSIEDLFAQINDGLKMGRRINLVST